MEENTKELIVNLMKIIKRINPERLLSDKSVANMLDISRDQVHRLKRQGILPQPVKIQGSTRWKHSEIIDYINSL